MDVYLNATAFDKQPLPATLEKKGISAGITFYSGPVYFLQQW